MSLRTRSVEVGVALVVVLLVVGALVGRGLATTQLHISDGLTWLGDDLRTRATWIAGRQVFAGP